MFCIKCGNELQEQWKNCPNCGAAVKTATDNNESNREIELSDLSEETAERLFEGQEITQAAIHSQAGNPEAINVPRKIKHRSFWKYLLLSFVTFGVYGIYSLYGFVKDINEICKGDDNESPNYIIVLLLSIVTCGIYGIYWWYKQGCRLKDAAPKFGVQLQESGSTVLIWYLLGCTIMPGVGMFVAVYIMFDNVNRISLGYNREIPLEELSRMEKPHPHLVRNVLIIYGVFLAVFIISITFLIKAAVSYDVSEEKESVTHTTKTEDYSNIDLEQYLGKPEEELIKAGFKYNDDDTTFEMLDGNVYIASESGKAFILVIAGESENLPSFHGVKIGMENAEAVSLLESSYVSEGELEGKQYYVDISAGNSVALKVDNGFVTEITAGCLTEDEIKEYKLQEYIFPDSDSKYLSEDEVRSVEADKLFIGRNEIFARHGYIFEDEGLKKYFGSTPWYQGTTQGNQFSADAVFNDFEKKNVELIKKIEDEIGGVNKQQSQEFVISEGTYTNDQLLPDRQALIMVSFASVDWVQVKILTTPESNMMTLYGPKIDYKTVQLTEEYTGITVTLNWDSAREVTLTSSGQFTGMDAGLFNELTNAHYSLAPGFW